ncbi:MAG: DUF3570 domain-containing protein [Thermodesulfobacteriota bacterium]
MVVINIKSKVLYLVYVIFSFMLLTNILAVEAQAEDYVITQGYAHIFNNNIGVYTTVFALNKDVTLDTSTYFKFTLDSIGKWEGWGEGEDDDDEREGRDDDDDDGERVSRVADAVSGASTATSDNGSSSGSDTRKEFTAGFTHNFNNIVGIEVFYDYSTEKDYISSTPSLTLKKELFEKNTTLTLSYSKNIDTVEGRFMTDSEDMDTDNYFFGITQVISPVTVAQFGYSRSNVKGQLANGTRLVPVDDTKMADCVDKSPTCVNEVFPDLRVRDAVMFGINHYFMARSSIQTNLRYYTDNWGISSHTEEITYYKYLTERALLRLNARYYDQTKADFVKDKYTNADTYKSSSSQLLRLDSQLFGIKLSYTLPGDFNFSWVDTGVIEGKYEFYTQSTDTNAGIFMVGLRLTF